MSKTPPEEAPGPPDTSLPVLLVSQAPGLGGGERVVIEPIARTSLDVTVAAWPEVASFARSLGLEAIDMALPFISGVSQIPSLVGGGRRIARLAKQVGARVLYANGSRAITYCLAATRFGAPPALLHHHGFLGKGPVWMLRAGARSWAKLVLTPSRAVADDLNVPGRTLVIPYGIDLTRFKPSENRAMARQSFGFEAKDVVAGYVMRAAPGKGIEDFLAMASILRGRSAGVKFLLAGGALFDDDRAYFSEITSTIAGMPDIRLTGTLQHTAPAYEAIDVFVHLADPEGFPTTAIEALASGIPVVGYDWGGLSELVAGGAGTLVPPKDVRAAGDAVLALTSAPDILQQASLAARRLAETRYAMERFSRDLEKAVREAVTVR